MMTHDDTRQTNNNQSKPFFAGVKKAVEDGSVSPLLKNWNFNVSHHGKYVAIASEPACLVRAKCDICGSGLAQRCTLALLCFIAFRAVRLTCSHA